MKGRLILAVASVRLREGQPGMLAVLREVLDVMAATR